MDEQAERLVRVETKLDGLINSMDVRLTHNEQKILEVEREARERTRHEKANQDQKFMALKSEIDAKADAKDVTLLQRIVFGGCGLILVAVIGAMIGGVVVEKSDGTTSHTPQAAMATDKGN